jgi:endonuclease-3
VKPARANAEELRRRKILRELQRLYPEAECALHFRSAYELLLATILSAQSTDKTVNQVTPALFAKYPSAKELARADLEELERLIHATGFFRNKARNLSGCAQVLVSQHNGEVPQTMAELTALPGVGRKTANVVLGNAFGMNEGIVVDTHVQRLSQRLGLTGQRAPEKIEQELMSRVPQKDWTVFSHRLILHGRQVCFARKPKCETCVLAKYCPSSQI